MTGLTIDTLEIIRSLDEPCWQCHRDGRSIVRAAYEHEMKREKRNVSWIGTARWIGGSHNTDTCGICSGVGYVLTDAGRAMVDFLRRWRDVDEKAVQP